MYKETFKNKIIDLIKKVDKDEDINIKNAADIIYQSMKKGGLLHIFCTGHSHMIAEEMFYRAGGLVQVNPILEPILMQHEGAFRSTKFERLAGLSKILFDSIDIKEGEPFLIVSNSGINVVPIEMAICAKEKKCPIVVITSKKISEKLESRHESKKNLYEYGDVIIDNHIPNGDGVIKTNSGSKIGASSTIIGAYIAQRLAIEIVANFERDGIKPDIYLSDNTNGGDEHNETILKKYKSRIRSLF